MTTSKLVTLGALLALAGCSSTAPAPDATAVTNKLTQAIPTAQLTIAYNEANDLNHMLGRPGGYTSKTSFRDTRIEMPPQIDYAGQTQADRDEYRTRVDFGGSVEVFDNEDDAKARAERVQAVSRATVSEYDYRAGRVLVRVSNKLTPAQAAEYERAVSGIDG